MFKILDIAQKIEKGGRVPTKIALLEIPKDISQTNANGIHWREDFVRQNIESASNMGIFAEFTDEDKEIPLGHGLTGMFTNKDGIQEPEFKNSEGVGVIEKATIENIFIGDKQIRALVGEGYFFGQRYPEFVNWVRVNNELGGVDTSIEIVGKKENNGNIVYLEGEDATQEYRTPKEFDFSGTAILSVEPADANAKLLEIAEKQKKEDMQMNEEIKNLIVQTITETNSKNAEYETKISELNAQIVEKDTTIAETNATVEELQSAISEVKKEKEALEAEKDALENELGALKAAARLAEMESMIAVYSEEEQKYAETEIEAFRKDPMGCSASGCGMKEINEKICVGIVEKQRADAKAEAEKKAELNAKEKETKTIDIYGYMPPASEDKGADISIY